MTEQPIEDVPPSAKLVYKVLEYNGGLTQKEIVEKSMLSQRTVRDALSRLREIDVVSEEVYIPDARQNLYTLSVGEEEEAVAEADGGADAEPNVTDCR
jgi:transcription initiation factor IIE alpha subunit